MAACGEPYDERTVDVVEYLLDEGADVDHADDDGFTALHFAAQVGRLDVAEVLFRSGAKLDARTNDGRTPADIATANGHHAFADAIRAEEIRRRDHGFKRDRSTIEGTEEHEAAKRPRVEEEQQQQQEEEVDESDDDDDDDDEEEEA
jgi:ankyrin repeat protein